MSSIGFWKSVQAVTGLGIGTFTTLHIANQLLAIRSQDAYDGFMVCGNTHTQTHTDTHRHTHTHTHTHTHILIRDLAALNSSWFESFIKNLWWRLQAWQR